MSVFAHVAVSSLLAVCAQYIVSTDVVEFNLPACLGATDGNQPMSTMWPIYMFMFTKKQGPYFK